MGRDRTLRRFVTTMLLVLAVTDAGRAFAKGDLKKMSDDERAIIELHDVFAAAWSKGDTTGAAATYAEDGGARFIGDRDGDLPYNER